MKLVTPSGVLAGTVPDSDDDDAWDAALRDIHARTSATLLFGHGLVVKHVRPSSHEADNLARLQTMIPAEHVSRVKRKINDRWLVLERVPSVFPRMSSFHDMLHNLRSVPMDIVQSCLAQIVALLLTLQASDSTFAHNDFKADNILLQLEDRPSPLRIGSFDVKHVGVRVVLIDMETVTGRTFPALHLPSVPNHVLEVFGLDPSMEWCCWTDFHLLCMELYKQVLHHKPKWADECLQFLSDATPTLRVFSTFESANMLVTSMNRLSGKGRRMFNALIQQGHAKELAQLPQCSFLCGWMMHHQTATTNEMAADTTTTISVEQSPMDTATS